ncbi:MAG: type II secretion system protein [Candidatus Aminicenantes bacterium]|nr:type II secretion system protein [Candidatus Aminicenantes bacterium]
MKNKRGFTLVELLIVVSIIGILAVLLFPNVITAVQKAKQKETMKAITTVATAIADYITDNGRVPEQPNGNQLSTSDPFYGKLSTFYIRAIPVNDEWGTYFMVWTLTDVNGKYGISTATECDYLVVSYARDGTEEAWTFFEDEPAAGLFDLNTMQDFNNDLISLTGYWIRAPRRFASTSS